MRIVHIPNSTGHVSLFSNQKRVLCEPALMFCFFLFVFFSLTDPGQCILCPLRGKISVLVWKNRKVNNDKILLVWVNYYFKTYKLRNMHHVTTWIRKGMQLLVIDFKAVFEVFSFASFLLFIQQETMPLFFPLKMTCVRSLCTLIHYSNTLHTRSFICMQSRAFPFCMILRPPVKSWVITEVFQAIKDPRKKAFKRKELLIKKQKYNTIEDFVQLRHNKKCLN